MTAQVIIISIIVIMEIVINRIITKNDTLLIEEVDEEIVSIVSVVKIVAVAIPIKILETLKDQGFTTIQITE
jgi:hypothetical protein